MPISDQSEKLNKALHQANKDYGGKKQRGIGGNVPYLIKHFHENGLCNSFLDYGTGKGHLVDDVRLQLGDLIHIDGYDPCIDAYSASPKLSRYDLITCLDVLEHIEAAEIYDVIKEISSYLGGVGVLVIDLMPAVKFLDDGRNAHVLLAPYSWWASQIAEHFRYNLTMPILNTDGHVQKFAATVTHRPEYMSLLYPCLKILGFKTFRYKNASR